MEVAALGVEAARVAAGSGMRPWQHLSQPNVTAGASLCRRCHPASPPGALPPLQVMVLLVGINNLLPTNPWEKLDFLLNKHLAAAMPGTKVLVVAPLPSFLGTSPTLTQQYRWAVP